MHLQMLYNVKSLIRHYLRNNDTTDFGCACTPDGKICGPCQENKRQENLLRAIKEIEDYLLKDILNEDAAYTKALSIKPRDIQSDDSSKWWFGQGYQSAKLPKLELWKESVIDELVTTHIYNEKHDADPRFAIKDLINWHVTMALDPSISSDAQALIDRGANLSLPTKD